MVLGPALFCPSKFFLTPKEIALAISGARQRKTGNFPSILALGRLAGNFWPDNLFSAFSWHSVFFPYLCRFNVAFCPASAPCAFPTQSRRRNLAASPVLLPSPALTQACRALLYPAIFIVFLAKPQKGKNGKTFFIIPDFAVVFHCSCLFFRTRSEIAQTIISHANAYLSRGADTLVSGANTLVYPSVAQKHYRSSGFGPGRAFFHIFHPWQEGAIAGLLSIFLADVQKAGHNFFFCLLALGLL